MTTGAGSDVTTRPLAWPNLTPRRPFLSAIGGGHRGDWLGNRAFSGGWSSPAPAPTPLTGSLGGVAHGLGGDGALAALRQRPDLRLGAAEWLGPLEPGVLLCEGEDQLVTLCFRRGGEEGGDTAPIDLGGGVVGARVVERFQLLESADTALHTRPIAALDPWAERFGVL
eukprot:CAMPEP_0181176094 /NCGR_PEP_ID=MMETSP1096-20121128/4439_1 /TAXON_ID=156174 ORGANISM="Chrysochromulina ericina, Strain CCMP281" /NCGR_SAMPLE_ID=MMETSP1096 /ASSEMBLY_ACC=CAM_ASM_000453 /LENGTH=168 /DNA_ID=CAMNT_0023264145 /DNA_START=452 /DNA_END=957 /DNA_ORIENTATION=-